jgi:hypothetical protein
VHREHENALRSFHKAFHDESPRFIDREKNHRSVFFLVRTFVREANGSLIGDSLRTKKLLRRICAD